MIKIVRLLVLSLIAILISTPLIAGGHKYIAPPVIFVHGFNANSGSWDTTKNNLENLYLHKYGYEPNPQNPNDPSYLPLLNYGAAKLGEFSKNGDCTVIATETDTQKGLGLATVIYRAIENLKIINPGIPEEEQKVILVCHSFGGLVLRSLLKQNENAAITVLDSAGNSVPVNPGFFQKHIANVIFVGVPHQGSPLASALWILTKLDNDLGDRIDQYRNKIIDIGLHKGAQQGDNEAAYEDMRDQLILFKYQVLNSICYADIGGPFNINGYGKAVEQCRLNKTVSFNKVFIGLNGLVENVHKSFSGSETFLGQGGNLGIPAKYDTIYAETHDPSRAGYLLSWWTDLNRYKQYFTFPAGEDIDSVMDKGDVVVTSDSQRLGGAAHQYLLTGVAHFGGLTSGECDQYETIKEVLCEDPPIMNIQEPLPRDIYTTKFPFRAKLRNYLPLDCLVEVLLYKQAGGNSINSFVLKYVPNVANSPIQLNSNYEENKDNYQALVCRTVDHSQPYDTGLKLVVLPINAAAIEGAQQTINFTYKSLVSTTTPTDNGQNIPLDATIQITFGEKIRQGTFNNNINFGINGGYDINWLNDYEVELTPNVFLQPDTTYSITLIGDDPSTEDNLTTPGVIENLTGIEYYLTDQNDPLDRHGFDPDYTFTFTTGSNLGGGGGGGAGGGGGFPGGGHPDDNYGVETGSQNPQPIEGEIKVGLLGNGFGYDTYVMLNSLNINTRLIRLNNLDLAFQYPVLVIPTAGLYGLDNSATFKQKLTDYVSQGGTIICYTQQYGQEFSALPGGQIVGFGWEEDQACWGAGAVYINEVSAVFNGQSSATPSVNVDGYFTKWPENAKILLNRGKNGLPDLIEYTYGQGRVIVSGLYSDWANGHSQRTQEEYILAKQLIEYALDPSQPLTQNLAFKDTSIKMWVTSPTEYTVAGSTVPYTIHVQNNSSTDLVGANVSFYGHEQFGNPFYYIGSIEDITVAVGEEKTFLQNVLVTRSNTYLINLFEPGVQYKDFSNYNDFWNLAKINTQRVVWVNDPQVTLAIKTNKNVYGPKDSSSTVQIDLKELQGINYQASLKVSILDPNNSVCSEQTIPLDIIANSELQREVLGRPPAMRV